MPEPIRITGCRHDVFGHALKALGLLRAINVCAAQEHLDREAEAWWDTDTGAFCLSSPKYPSENDLARFLECHYRPTPIFSPWNTGGGMDDKQEVVITFTELVCKKRGKATPAKPDAEAIQRLMAFLDQNEGDLTAAGLDVGKKKEKPPRTGEFSFVLEDRIAFSRLKLTKGISVRVKQKTSGEKAVMARAETALQGDAGTENALRLGRDFFARFQSAKSPRERRELFVEYRDQLDEGSAIALDAVFAIHALRVNDNPVFLDRGKAGNTEIFRSFWGYFLDFRRNPGPQIGAALRGSAGGGFEGVKAPGAPFFPDQIKTYNNGMEWVLDTYPFCALDYILAVEGALALRGSAARLLAARSGNFAAFPFVFETAEDMTDDQGDVKGTALSLWLPVWTRPATFGELQSFILDSQAHLPGREARFTQEFARAIRSQGVDAGFDGYQEFRFKMRGVRVPWVCTGRYFCVAGRPALALAADLLGPLDEIGFLDQLRIDDKNGREHRRLLTTILDALEDAVSECEPHRYLIILENLFEVTRLLALSKRFRDAIENPVFPRPLPQAPWLEALKGLEFEPEFEIARALASIVGHARQKDGTQSPASPFLGSVLPLRLAESGWHLPNPPSPEAVWGRGDLCLDLARVLARRYQDSRGDDHPALASPWPARLTTVLRFLHGELDDARIARHAEALSLIGWHFASSDASPLSVETKDEPRRPIPLPYAAVRSLLETEFLRRPEGEQRRCVSYRALALLRERSTSGVADATVEALQRLGVIGLPDPYTDGVRERRRNLAGRDIVRVERGALSVADMLTARIAAAVCVPLHWRDRLTLFRAITIPQAPELKEDS